MSINREIVLTKLTEYLNGRMTKTAVYEWALSAAVSREYESIIKEDPLLQKVIFGLIDINHQDAQAVPTRETLDYYRRCLAGEEEFNTDPAGSFSRNLPVGSRRGGKPQKRNFLVLLRTYVVIFSLSSLGIHLFSIIDPSFLQLGDDGLSRSEVWKDKETVFNLVYAFFVLLPPRWLNKGIGFYFSFITLFLGMLYYWYISIIFIEKFSLNWIFILVILPFSAIPASLALLLLIIQRERIKKL